MPIQRRFSFFYTLNNDVKQSDALPYRLNNAALTRISPIEIQTQNDCGHMQKSRQYKTKTIRKSCLKYSYTIRFQSHLQELTQALNDLQIKHQKHENDQDIIMRKKQLIFLKKGMIKMRRCQIRIKFMNHRRKPNYKLKFRRVKYCVEKILQEEIDASLYKPEAKAHSLINYGKDIITFIDNIQTACFPNSQSVAFLENSYTIDDIDINNAIHYFNQMEITTQ